MNAYERHSNTADDGSVRVRPRPQSVGCKPAAKRSLMFPPVLSQLLYAIGATGAGDALPSVSSEHAVARRALAPTTRSLTSVRRSPRQLQSATVVSFDAIAAGKRAATMIGRYLRSEELIRPAAACLPDVFVDPVPTEADELENGLRAEPPVLPAATRRCDFDEVEMSLTEEDAKREARRCLRCDLDFTRPRQAERTVPMTVGASA